MKNFLQNETKQFTAFFHESKWLIPCILFFILMSYGIKIVNYDISIDTEVILNDYTWQMVAWDSIGRIGLVFTKKIFFLGQFNPYVANFLTYFTFTFACFLICFLIQRILTTHTKKWAMVIVPILFLTHPIFAEQFNFILQSFEVALAILWLVLALLFSYYYVTTNSKGFALLAILLCIWGFLTYQSLLLFYISGAIASFLLLLFVHEKENQVQPFPVYASIVLKYFLIFLFSFIFSQMIAYLFLKVSGIPSSSYLIQKIVWGKLPVSEVFERIFTVIQSVIMAKGSFYNYGLLISMILIFLILIGKAIKKNKALYLELPAFLLLFISPFLLTIFIGKSEVIRAQMPALQWVIAFAFFYIYLNINRRLLQKLLIAFSVILAFHQSNVTANLLFSEHTKYQEDVTLANRINFQLDSMGIGDRSSYSLIILGKYEPKSITNIRGETLGHSFFEWDITTKAGSSKRVVGFMRTLGYPFKYPKDDQLDYAHTIKNEMNVWPAKDSIRIINNRLIIVKLSD